MPTDSITFRTHRKIAEPERAAKILNRDVDSFFGSAELIETPYELFRVARTALFGQQVVVYFDSYRRVEMVEIEGERVYSRPITLGLYGLPDREEYFKKPPEP